MLLSVCLTLQESLGEFLNVLCVAKSDVGLGLLAFDAQDFGHCALVCELEFLGHLGDKHVASVAIGVHNEEVVPIDAERDYAVGGLLDEHIQVGVAWFKSLLFSEPCAKTEVSVSADRFGVMAFGGAARWLAEIDSARWPLFGTAIWLAGHGLAHLRSRCCGH